MKPFDDHFESARRHFGVALIDLNYAAADLANSIACADLKAAAVELLNLEIERLTELSAFIDRVAKRLPGDAMQVSDSLRRWWPDLVGHGSAAAERD
jgi:hypothetical protein